MRFGFVTMGKSFNFGKTFMLSKSVTRSFTCDNVEIINISILRVFSSWFPYIYIYGFTTCFPLSLPRVLLAAATGGGTLAAYDLVRLLLTIIYSWFI